MNKVSLRFYKDYKVRAVWDENLGRWWFSVLDVVGAINEQDDYLKTRNYWKYLKTKLKNEGSEVVSVTNQLKLLAPDGKRRLKMCVDWSQIDKKAYLAAMRRSTTDTTAIKSLLQSAMTDKIADRELFMKGIDYSYYYEQVD